MGKEFKQPSRSASSAVSVTCKTQGGSRQAKRRSLAVRASPVHSCSGFCLTFINLAIRFSVVAANPDVSTDAAGMAVGIDHPIKWCKRLRRPVL